MTTVTCTFCLAHFHSSCGLTEPNRLDGDSIAPDGGFERFEATVALGALTWIYGPELERERSRVEDTELGFDQWARRGTLTNMQALLQRFICWLHCSRLPPGELLLT
ncbi:hypothetical protein AAFF_G00263810 [Aldrovandia affinis]|uniref:Uncharacterized protein n=1 Tax=Aldrovandia affinis TaxID=143900 RepID=A0AAD7SU03_9TELE|nr:hypothetical protein AAFF_G00263810 [Aldrovandia affinis]